MPEQPRGVWESSESERATHPHIHTPWYPLCCHSALPMQRGRESDTSTHHGLRCVVILRCLALALLGHRSDLASEVTIGLHDDAIVALGGQLEC